MKEMSAKWNCMGSGALFTARIWFAAIKKNCSKSLVYGMNDTYFGVMGWKKIFKYCQWALGLMITCRLYI